MGSENKRPTFIIDVNVIFLDDTGRWLFSQRANTGFKDGQYSFVAGHLESSESLKQGAIRESFEEVGVFINEDDLMFVHVMRRDVDSTRLSVFFTCKKWGGVLANKEPDKCSDLAWHNPTSPPTPVVDYIGYVVAAILRGEMTSDFTAAMATKLAA